jgi:hypothetical protein
MSARTTPDLLPAPGQHDDAQPCPESTPAKASRDGKGPTCNIFTFGKYPTRVPRIPPWGFPDTPIGFLDPILGSRASGYPACAGAWPPITLGIMRQQETRALRSGFFVSSPEAAGAASDALSGGG